MTNIANNESTLAKTKKLYSVNWIFFGAWFGGPLAGCYLLNRNFATLGQKALATKTLIFGILFSLILFSGLILIPNSILSKIPNSLIPIIYTFIIYQYAIRNQGKAINAHIKNGGLKYSGWRVLGIVILSLLISIAYCFLLFVLMMLLFPGNGLMI